MHSQIKMKLYSVFLFLWNWYSHNILFIYILHNFDTLIHTRARVHTYIYIINIRGEKEKAKNKKWMLKEQQYQWKVLPLLHGCVYLKTYKYHSNDLSLSIELQRFINILQCISVMKISWAVKFLNFFSFT